MRVIVVAQDEWSPKPEVAQDRFYCIITDRYTNPAACGFFFCVSSQAGTPTQRPVASSFVYHHRPVHQPSGLWLLLLCIITGRYTNPAACGFFFCVSSQAGTPTQWPVASSFVYHHRPVHQPSGLWLLLLCIITIIITVACDALVLTIAMSTIHISLTHNNMSSIMWNHVFYVFSRQIASSGITDNIFASNHENLGSL